MKRTTNIEWTQHTWNPFVGCSIVTSGCKNCYAMKMAARLEAMNVEQYKGTVKKVNDNVVWTGKINQSSISAINKPKTIKKPSLFFVNSMSDFFHENADDKLLITALNVIRECKQHMFQILTKRPENIQPFLDRASESIPDNVWLGVTVENNKTSYRINILRNIKCKTRFISFEPLIGDVGNINLSDMHWVISGGESGARCRDCNYQWLQNIDSLCKSQSIPHFFKQYGHWRNNPLSDRVEVNKSDYVANIDPIGKGGSLLNGVYIKEYPIIYSQEHMNNIA